MACDRTELWLGLLGFGLRILHSINILESISVSHHGWYLLSWVCYKDLSQQLYPDPFYENIVFCLECHVVDIVQKSLIVKRPCLCKI